MACTVWKNPHYRRAELAAHQLLKHRDRSVADRAGVNLQLILAPGDQFATHPCARDATDATRSIGGKTHHTFRHYLRHIDNVAICP
eukprot:COSAG06_NODE_39302_length_414_cov_0.822222_1_plen_85_part_10